VLRHSISTKLRLGALALLLACGAAAAPPDPVAYGNRVESGDISQVREWLDGGLDPDFLADRIGTGLMIGAWTGNLKMMELLAARGASVNKANALGETALMHAAWRGNADAVKWLLAKGAKVNSDPMRWSALHYAAFAGHGAVADLLLQNGADINARSTNGSSVLMMAVYEGHEPLVKQLLARGADRGIRNDRGDSALEWAFKFQRLSIARLVSAPQEFAAAANQPKSRWGAPLRSLREGEAVAAPPPVAAPDPMGDKIEELMNLRQTLALRGLGDAILKLDKRIAALRAQRARAERTTPASAVLEISASRASPENQRMRMIFGTGGPPP
jgi:ankyrin repeat protein